ncbi:hypothetical protein BIW11_13217 [Tropilaelaps mercedesae]|uniref:Uncharacterized protein n=1 Tax=Tropilaelaps mercedesae TaxID=418985 RepID=A0A1V9X375_9ACAR|nr:hypothetical protein BIW11_13217 [Tropilaelaps mercedesae]
MQCVTTSDEAQRFASMSAPVTCLVDSRTESSTQQMRQDTLSKSTYLPPHSVGLLEANRPSLTSEAAPSPHGSHSTDKCIIRTYELTASVGSAPRIGPRQQVASSQRWLELLRVAVATLIVAAATPIAAAWNLQPSLSNATATYVAALKEFHVYLLPEEILGSIILPEFNCSVVDEEIFVTRSGGNATHTMLQWNKHAPAESDSFVVALTCWKPDDETDVSNVSAFGDIQHDEISAKVTGGPKEKPPARRRRDAPSSPASDTVEGTTQESKEFGKNSSSSAYDSNPDEAAEATKLDASTPWPAPQVNPEIDQFTSPTASVQSNGTSPATPRTDTPTQHHSAASSNPTTDSEQGRSPTPTRRTNPITNSEQQTDPAPQNDHNSTLKAEDTTFLAMSTSASPNDTADLRTSNNFSLVITRLSLDFVQAQMLNSFKDVENITGDMYTLLDHGNISKCVILPKGVRAVNRRYILLAVAETLTGEVVRAGHMLSVCGRSDWTSASWLLPEPSRSRMLASRNFQLQILCVALTAVVVVFALLAVFLCTKWRLAVRGSRRENSAEIYVKTFHTQEHRYKPDDNDPYGFPTVPRNSTFYRGANDVNGRASGRGGGTNLSMGRSSFVNGGFYEESPEALPPPPPELRACLIDDAHFTDVPLHNLGSDSLGRAHRGVRASPPVLPVRTISSGYNTTSGQSSPASPSTSPLSPVSPEYHRPHEVLAMMPPIPKEDYSDSEEESASDSQRHPRQGSIPQEDQQARDQRRGRFTVRTAL